FFFFSSRRRHTRFSRDWSSDVCSSDLLAHLVRAEQILCTGGEQLVDVRGDDAFRVDYEVALGDGKIARAGFDPDGRAAETGIARSEERRVGKERRRGRSRDAAKTRKTE